VHRWFAAKACPGDWMMARMGELASRVTSALKPSTGTTEYIEYVVKRGDTLTKIAKAYNVTVNDIVAVNPQITNPSKISAGQVIKIPIVGRDIPAYHTVNKEDGLNSLSKIAKRYGISLAQIKELNPQVKAPLYIIHNGDKIRIK
jgi:LysM repeat protein